MSGLSLTRDSFAALVKANSRAPAPSSVSMRMREPTGTPPLSTESKVTTPVEYRSVKSTRRIFSSRAADSISGTFHSNTSPVDPMHMVP